MPRQPARSPRVLAIVKPPLLRWARETAAMSVDDAARRIGVKADRLHDWEEGRLRPSVPQLRNVARVYKRPLAVFFMSQPPAQPQPPHDFRRLPEEEEPPPTSPALVFAMRRARRRRTVALELLDESVAGPRPLPLRASLRDDPEAVASRLRDLLGVPLQEQARWRSEHAALNGWIAACEARDILVFQTSDVPLDEMRGFSLSETTLPVIFLNAADLPRARAFTLMHEVAHLVLNVGGLCDPQRARPRGRSPDEDVEVFCNHVAGSVLVPGDALMGHPLVAAVRARVEWAEKTIQELAYAFAVSREVILRRLLILGRTTEQFYERKRQEYLAQYRLMAQQREQSEEGGFAPYHLIVLRNNGRRYTQMVLDAFAGERIAPGDVVDFLGVRLHHLEDISGAIRRRAAAGEP